MKADFGRSEALDERAVSITTMPKDDAWEYVAVFAVVCVVSLAWLAGLILLIEWAVR